MKRYLAAGLLLALTACDENTERKNPTPRADAVPVAKEAAQETFAMLSAELAAALEKGGPVAAIPVCSERAGEITREVASRKNVGIVRLSDRPRNPEQQAQGDDLAAMEQFRAEMKAGRELAPIVNDLQNGKTVVHLPIVIGQPLCLQCHGNEDEVAAATREAILEIYPEDRARGYTLNDLRGLWKVTVPADSVR